MPLPYHSAFEIPMESSDTPDLDDSRSSPATGTILLRVSSNPTDAEALSTSSSTSPTLTASSSVTLTASECENELSELVFVEPSYQNVPRKKKYFRKLFHSRKMFTMLFDNRNHHIIFISTGYFTINWTNTYRRVDDTEELIFAL